MLPAYEAVVCGASSKKQEAPQHLERLQNAPPPEDKRFVRPLNHAQEIRFSFTSIPSLRGSLGTPDVVGPRALAEWNRLLPDAVTQQLTCSQGAGASDASSLLEGKAWLGARGTTSSTKPRPLRPDDQLPRLSELPHVGGASEPRHHLLMNNAGSGGVPDPEVELQSHGSG